VPPEHQPVDRGVLLGRLARALIRREHCLPSSEPLPIDGDEAFLLQTLALLERSDPANLAAVLAAAWHGPRTDTPQRIGPAIATLRRGLEELLVGRSLNQEDIEPALRALHVAHGPVRTA